MNPRRSPLEMWDGPCYQDLLDRDGQDVLPVLREHPFSDLGTETVAASRYTSPAFHALEVEHVFLKSWQMACREEDIPNAGDTYVFDLVGRSAIVIRQEDGRLKAFLNVCLHRGRKLVTSNGCKKVLRCPYHAFTWATDGTFRANAVAWDFPEIDRDDFPLIGLPLETWGGFVFVNFGKHPRPFAELIAPLEEHFADWFMKDSYRSAYIAQEMPGNWKVVAEAFIENHHVTATHPQIASTYGDANSQIDIFSDHVGRAIAPFGVSGLLYEGGQTSDRQMVERTIKAGSKAGKVEVDVPDDVRARQFMGAAARANVMAATGRDLSGRADAEFMDGISYDFFPNFHIWGGLGRKISYRFRPLDEERTFIELMLYQVAPVDRPVPPPAPMILLQKGEKWGDYFDEIGFLAPVYDQDLSNIVWMQEGLTALGDGPVHFARYSEMRLRNLHRTIDKYIEEGQRDADAVQEV